MIDEYDVPLDKAFQHGYYKEMTVLIRSLFSQVLKTNDALYFAVKQLLKDYGLEEHFEETKEWYDGYRFGQTDVYCPWDVINP